MGTLAAVGATHVYGPLVLSEDQWTALHTVAVADILQGAASPVDCGTVTSTVAQGQVAAPPPSPAPSSVVAPTGALRALLPTLVTDLGAARAACAAVALCTRVDVFTRVGFTDLLAVYSCDPTGVDGFGFTRDAAGAPGPPPPSTGVTWAATVTVDRTLGYWCPGGTSPDPVFLYQRYVVSGDAAGLVAAGLVPSPEALGLTPDALPAELDPLGAPARALAWSWATWGHRWRLWPNAACALTPVTRDGATGCSRAVCPLFTLCPPGFRTQVPGWGTCFPSPSGDPAGVLLPGQVLSFAPASGVLVVQGPGPEDPPVTLNAGAAVEVAPGAPGGVYLPCGPGGTCVHGGAPGDPPVCACNTSTTGGVGVVGDTGCALTPAACFPGDVPRAAWSPAGVCSGHGTCTHTRATVNWYAADLSAPTSGAVACVCLPPWTGPLCATTLCAAGAPADCGAVGGGGTCVPAPSAPTGWACACTRPHFGPGCTLVDGPQGAPRSPLGRAGTTGAGLRAAAVSGGEAPPYACWTTGAAVAAPPPGATDVTPLLCAGRGVCVPTPGGGPPAGTCVCDPGWAGPRCEWPACDHAACAPYGRCILDTDATGRAVTTCACAVHEDDAGLVLARGGPDTPGACTVAECVAGVLTLTWGAVGTGPTDLPPNVTDGVPRGVCTCAPTVFVVGAAGAVPGATTTLTGTDPGGTSVALSGPVHPWLPTVLGFTPVYAPTSGLVVGYTPYAVLPNVVGVNEGVLCDAPACPKLVDPTTGGTVPGARPCGVDSVAVATVCVPCAPGDTSPFCVLTGGAGGVCDCAGAAAAAAGAALPWVHPGTGVRWAASPVPENPLCDPYCAHGGVWVPAAAACECAGTGWWGPTCNVPRCPRGTSGTTGPNCTACDGPGWDPATACTACARGFTGPTCATCAPGYFEPPGAPGTCASCAEVAALTCGGTGVATFTCGPTGPVCVCAPGHVTTPAGPCTGCGPGYTMVTTGAAAGRCTGCFAAAGCGPFTARAVCGPPLGCECVQPGMNARCTACAAGTRLVNGTCMACGAALGCAPGGTVAAVCPGPTPGPRDACVCNTTAGAGGPRCAGCAPGWTPLGGTCARCNASNPVGGGAPCGPWGALDCTTPTAPRCACTRGWSGPACGTCSGCGPGGTCVTNATTPDAPPCVCAPGWLPASNGSCTLCDAADHVAGPEGTCVPVRTLCGPSPGVDPAGTAATGRAPPCVCWPGWTGPTCDTCAPGHAGPVCAPCTGPVPDPAHAVCTWDAGGRAAVWACTPGWALPGCTTCAAGWAAQGATCAPCPVCGPGGVCTPGGTSPPSCACQPGYTHATPGNASSPCSLCDPEVGAVPGPAGTCVVCGPCGPGRVCTPTLDAQPPGTGTCVCAAGLRVLHGTNATHPAVACFPLDVAVALEAGLPPGPARDAAALLGPGDTPPQPQQWTTTTPGAAVPWAFLGTLVAMAAGAVILLVAGVRRLTAVLPHAP